MRKSFLFKNFFGFSKAKWRATTILALKKDKEIVLIGDGQVTYGSMRVKTTGNKIRKIGDNVVCGFAADAFSLMEGIENSVKKYPGNTLRACVEYAKEWRTEATMLVCDKDLIVEMDGVGNVLEIEEVIGIGSGGAFAECAAKALLDLDGFDAETIARKAMKIAAEKCIYTSSIFSLEKINWA